MTVVFLIRSLAIALTTLGMVQDPQWVEGEDILKNPTLSDQAQRSPQSMSQPAFLDLHVRHGTSPSTCLKGVEGRPSSTSSLISPVPFNRRLTFTFYGYTRAKGAAIGFIGIAFDGNGNIIRGFTDGPNGPFGVAGTYGQLERLLQNQWVKIERTYLLPPGTAMFRIPLSNFTSEDIYVTDGRLTVGKLIPLSFPSQKSK